MGAEGSRQKAAGSAKRDAPPAGIGAARAGKRPRRSPWLTLAFTVAAIAFLVVYLSAIGIDQVVGVLLGANIWLLGLSVVLVYAGMFMDFLVWYDLLRRVEPTTRVLSSFRIYLVAFTAGYMIPSGGVSNVAARVLMCAREPWGKLCGGPRVFSTVMAHTLVGFVTFVVSVILALVGLYFVFHVSLTVMLILLVLLAILVFVVVELVIVLTNSAHLIRFVERLRRWLKKVPRIGSRITFLDDVDDKIHSLTGHFSDFFNDRWLFLRSFSVVMASRAVLWVAVYVALLSLGFTGIPFLLVVIASIIIMLLAFIPLGIPGMEGIKEVVLSEIFVISLGDRVLSGAAGIISNIDFYFTVLVGAILYAHWSIKHRRD